MGREEVSATAPTVKERWLSNQLSVVGMIIGLLAGVGLMTALRPKSESISTLFLLFGSYAGGYAGHLISRRIKAAKFQQGLGLLLCSTGTHWYGQPHRRDSRTPIGGFECLRCGFRPDGGKPRLPHHG